MDNEETWAGAVKSAGCIKKDCHRDTSVLPHHDPPGGPPWTRRRNGAGGL